MENLEEQIAFMFINSFQMQLCTVLRTQHEIQPVYFLLIFIFDRATKLDPTAS